MCQHSSDKPPDKRPHPQLHCRECCTPFPRIVAKGNFEWEINEHGEGEVFLAEAFVEEFEVCDGVICLEADFGDEVDYDEGLYVCVGVVGC